MQCQVVVIGKHSEGSCRYRKQGQSQHIVLNLLSSVLIAAIGKAIKATQEGTPDTARNTMVEGGGVQGDLLTSGFCYSGYSYSKLRKNDNAESALTTNRHCSHFRFNHACPAISPSLKKNHLWL